MQLKYYAERKSPILLRDSYTARAYSKESLSALLEKDHGRITNIIICTAVFVVTLSFIVIIMVLGYFFCTRSHSSSNWAVKVKKHYSAVFALTGLSLIANFYILCLASSALGFWTEQGKKELSKLFHDFDEKRNLGPLIWCFLVDIVCLVVWCVTVIVVVIKLCYRNICNQRNRSCTCCTHAQHEHVNGMDCVYVICQCVKCARDCEHITKCDCTRCDKCKDIPCFYDYILILSTTVLCPTFCVIAHSPYIAIAYLNDGSHASSIFIYYTILGYSLFGLLYLFSHWFENVTPMYKFNMDKNCVRFWTILFLIIVIFVFLGLVVVISCYFVLIPINKAISDAPNRVLSIYQSGGFVIGSIIVYEVLSHFHKKKKEESTIEYIKKIQEDIYILKNYQCQPAANTPHNGADAAQSGSDGDPRADTSIPHPNCMEMEPVNAKNRPWREPVYIPQMPLLRGTTTPETTTEMHTTSTSELTPTGGNHH